MKKCNQKQNTHLPYVGLLYPLSSVDSRKHQETGAVLKDSEIGQAYEFGNEAEVRNILEPNPWEAHVKERAKNQTAVDHILEDDKERRQREDEGEDLEEEEDDKKGVKKWLGKQKAALPKIVARTRVSVQEPEERDLVLILL